MMCSPVGRTVRESNRLVEQTLLTSSCVRSFVINFETYINTTAGSLVYTDHCTTGRGPKVLIWTERYSLRIPLLVTIRPVWLIRNTRTTPVRTVRKGLFLFTPCLASGWLERNVPLAQLIEIYNWRPAFFFNTVWPWFDWIGLVLRCTFCVAHR